MRRDGREEVIPSKGVYTLETGERLLLWTSGGGGYGDPLNRPVPAVLDDVLDRKIYLEAAARDYGVVIDPETREVNKAETEVLRERRRLERGPITWTYDKGEERSSP